MSIQKIYSNTEPQKLLHIVHKIDNDAPQRIDIVPAKEFLQLSCLRLSKNKQFEAHEHVYKPGEPVVIAQESWVVIKGKIRFFAYDLDGTLLSTVDLSPGDCSITLYGGHNYKILEEDTLVYEYKTGPYKGQKLDKRFINRGNE